MIKVVLGKISEEINYVSIYQNHVTVHMVQIWLHNRSTKLPWNCNKNMELQISCFEYIVFDMGHLSQATMILMK